MRHNESYDYWHPPFCTLFGENRWGWWIYVLSSISARMIDRPVTKEKGIRSKSPSPSRKRQTLGGNSSQLAYFQELHRSRCAIQCEQNTCGDFTGSFTKIKRAYKDLQHMNIFKRPPSTQRDAIHVKMDRRYIT